MSSDRRNAAADAAEAFLASGVDEGRISKELALLIIMMPSIERMGILIENGMPNHSGEGRVKHAVLEPDDVVKMLVAIIEIGEELQEINNWCSCFYETPSEMKEDILEKVEEALPEMGPCLSILGEDDDEEG